MDKNNYFEPAVGMHRAYIGAGACGVAQQGKDAQPIESNSVVRDQLSAHEETLSELHGTISRLEARLDTALTPMPPLATSATSDACGPPCSHVTLRLSALNSGYRHAVERLRELTQRVEV